MANAVIFNIQHFSVHDGPGVRSVVFFKGCGLRCFWCHNPESFGFSPELRFESARCIGCGECAAVCPVGAPEVRFTSDCKLCFSCADACFAGAIIREGREMSAEEVFADILRDRESYAFSGGGVTLSGGEPLLQSDFAAELLTMCKDAGIGTAVETSCFAPLSSVKKLLPLTDLFMCDIKAFDPELHRGGTGQTNERILENISYISENGGNMILRTPVIPGFNDSVKEISAIADFIRSLGKGNVLQLLPFHGLCSSKYASLGKEYPARGLETPSKEKMEALGEAVRARGVKCEVKTF